ncbi:unnamed protein product [Musa banksii]
MDWIEEHDESGRAMGRTWPASDKTKRRAAYSMLLTASPAPPPRAFGPMGSEYVDARAMSASITTSILVALRPQHLSSLGLFIKQVVTSSWPPTPELQSVTQATILLGHMKAPTRTEASLYSHEEPIPMLSLTKI